HMKTELIKFTDLGKFRRYWTGWRILDLIAKCGGKILITWPIGVGKSHNLDDLVETAAHSGRYDLVVALLPTRNVLGERRWIKDPPPNINIVNLRPRPSKYCSEDADSQWKIFESQGMGLLGRARLCLHCSLYSGCFWPHQYGRTLLGAQVIFATQVHLERDPTFITQLLLWTGAKKALIIVDEANFIAKSMRRRINRKHIEQLIDALKGIENAHS
ncbi:MAG: hypothetical protein WCO89_06115, partial [Syntrophus sp. (in: bacteria)]